MADTLTFKTARGAEITLRIAFNHQVAVMIPAAKIDSFGAQIIDPTEGAALRVKHPRGEAIIPVPAASQPAVDVLFAEAAARAEAERARREPAIAANKAYEDHYASVSRLLHTSRG